MPVHYRGTIDDAWRRLRALRHNPPEHRVHERRRATRRRCPSGPGQPPRPLLRPLGDHRGAPPQAQARPPTARCGPPDPCSPRQPRSSGSARSRPRGPAGPRRAGTSPRARARRSCVEDARSGAAAGAGTPGTRSPSPRSLGHADTTWSVPTGDASRGCSAPADPNGLGAARGALLHRPPSGCARLRRGDSPAAQHDGRARAGAAHGHLGHAFAHDLQAVTAAAAIPPDRAPPAVIADDQLDAPAEPVGEHTPAHLDQAPRGGPVSRMSP